MSRTLPLFFLFSLTAALLLLLPTTTTSHVNFEGNSIHEPFGNENAQGNLNVDIVSMSCHDKKNCSSSSVVKRSLGSENDSSETYVVAENATITVTSCISRYQNGSYQNGSYHRYNAQSCNKSSTTTNSNNTSTTMPPHAGFLSPAPSPSQVPTFLSPSPLSPLIIPIKTPTLVSGNQQFRMRKVYIGIAIVIGIIALLTCAIICGFKYNRLPKSDLDTETSLQENGAPTLQRYKFSEIKKMTKSFIEKLGEGSFGVVYKGESNGCPVAVKILNASKQNDKGFINEVSSISRTSHVNVVQLLGFCFEGSNKALIYEFMANGSLDKFIYNKELENSRLLSWDNLCQIAIGIARGLEYLHRGCNTQILHFDIKPHNILLDENFCPKVSDFGLAKLSSRKESTIHMSDQRGTTGYKAPEVCNRHLGRVSHKSDVYSYGMMLLEMVGGRKNIDPEAGGSELYFPYWIYNRLDEGNVLKLDKVLTTEENEIAKRMSLVGLWCVQTIPLDRPTMSEVIDMLEGKISLEIPPKPVLS
ncbi:LEAF RUST 10 DISEASE-RESISTANCE LOCUS RECEPTOR-LIKE PROTEIN KINASE-like 2.5 [Cajanus cajan]|uniref:LEAF RUST 10 DISEASE-RESISTANCE LOCUS RECEPTOR-LIKE PROTEIN KINASE-like 2.5 n=1 Tax=Cajanus cajan TaxID=3821 RepID=UPI00098DD2FC|nr:LEAF RUST 10 DISEASE-RESISTANCE LOCUS RECEPTOR-LIKE PROTEIN KINASE-like 2.5 [Cajanus cajan]